MSRPLALSLRLYRALARAFPYEFKNAYEDELVQVTEDAIEPIWRRYGVLGLLRLLVDLAVRVPAEHLSELRRDVRYALRMLAASPGFTAVALISLSLGICVATCAYSELNGLALRRLPGVPKPDELVALQSPTSYPKYRRYRELSELFSSTAAYVAPVPFGVWVGGRTERIWGHLVTPSYFSTLGVRPALGRFFGPEYEQPQSPAVVVSYRFWENKLGADPSAMGRRLRINGHPCTVIGVGPRDFLGASPMMFVADLWLPMSVGGAVAPELAGDALERRDVSVFLAVGRLQPGMSIARAEAQLDTVARQLEQSFGEGDTRRKGKRVLLLEGGRLIPIRPQDMPLFTVFFLVLGGTVLLIACANVANMMLARAADRRKEIAIRLSLGASRARLVRQLLTESMLLACGAGVAGLVLSKWIMHGASQLRFPCPMPISVDLEPDAGALLVTFGVTVMAGLAFGLVPALQATRADLTPALKEGGNVRLRRHRRLSLRNLLMVQQVAASLALLLLTAFLVSGVRRIGGTEVGFNPQNLYLLSLDPVRDGYSGAQAAAFFQKLLDRVQRLPGVTAACLTDTVPMMMNGSGGVQFSAAKQIHGAGKQVVGRTYFETTGIPILLGRGFRKEDEANQAQSIIVSEQLVREAWNGQAPLRRRIEIGGYEIDPYPGGMFLGTFDHRLGLLAKVRQTFEVVGVAKDTRTNLFMQRVPPVIYFPLHAADYARPSLQGVTLMVRAAPGVDALRAVRREVEMLDANLAPFNGRSMPEMVDEFIFVYRAAISTYGVIGAIGLILAAAGLAGLIAYAVAQRRREIGIRIALGARKGDVLRLVVREGMILVAVGTAIGLACTWAGVRVLSTTASTVGRSLTAGTSDPGLLVGAPLLLGGLALLACYLPARKSTRIDPVVALRQE